MLLLGVLCLISSAVALPYKEVIFRGLDEIKLERFDEFERLAKAIDTKNKIIKIYGVPPAPILDPLGGPVVLKVYDPQYEKHGKDENVDESEKIDDDKSKDKKVVLVKVMNDIDPKFTIPLPFPFPNINIPFSLSSIFSKPKYVYPGYPYNPYEYGRYVKK